MEHVGPVAHESARMGGLEQVLSCRRMEQLGEYLDRQHVVSLGGPARKISVRVTPFAGISVGGIIEDVGFEREARLNGHRVRPGRP